MAAGRAHRKPPRHAPKGVAEGGQFIGVSSVLHALQRHLGMPESPTTPNPDKAERLRGLTRRRLLAAARGQGLSPRRGKPDEDVISAMVARAGAGGAPSTEGGGRHRAPERHALPDAPTRAASRPARPTPAPSAAGRREAGRVLGPRPAPPPSETTARHVAALEAMGSREEAETYLSGVRGQALTDLARHYSAHFERTADGRRRRIGHAAVGSRLDSQAIRSLDPGAMGGTVRPPSPAPAPAPAPTHVISNREVAQLAMTMRTAHGMEHDEAIAYAQRLLLDRNPGATFETEPKPGALVGGTTRPTPPPPPQPNPDGLGAMSDRDLRDLAAEHGLENVHYRTPAELKATLRGKGAVSPTVRARRALQRQQDRAAVAASTVVPPPGPTVADRVTGRRPSAGLRISLALQDWSYGNGPDDPLTGKFTRAQLRTEAVARGITVRRNATDAHIAAALMEQTRQNFRARQSAIPNLRSVDDLMRNPDPAAIRAVFEGNYGGMTVAVRSIDGTGGPRAGLAVRGSILDAQGRHVGSFHRRYSRDQNGRIVAHHEFLQISGQVQGSGFSNAWNGHLIQWYRQNGVKEVRVHADIDVGGYAWARLGYNFANQRTANQILDRLNAFVDEIERRGDAGQRFPGSPDPAGQLREARALIARAQRHRFGSPQYPTPLEISQLGRWDGAGRTDSWIGKLALLQSDWYGVLPL
jgi:hypothetical protein